MKKWIKQSVLNGIVFSITVLLIFGWYISYAIWTGLKAQTWDSLTAEKWNAAITRLETLETEHDLSYEADWITLVVPSFWTQEEPWLSCKDILDKWGSIWDGIYWIKPVWISLAFEIYCDMTSDWWGWTTFFAWINGSINRTQWFESASITCTDTESDCITRIPSAVTASNKFAASCWDTMIKFDISSTMYNLFANGTQWWWTSFSNVETIKGIDNIFPNKFRTGSSGNNSFVISNGSATPYNAFLSSYNYTAVRDKCNWVSDTSSKIKLYYR
jgi:hypothetical protein